MHTPERIDIAYEGNTATVRKCGKSIGTITFTQNPYHASNCYLELNLQSYDLRTAKSVFSNLRHVLDKPLQIMLDCDSQDILAFIKDAGFVCMRKCYEVEASVQDYLGRKTGPAIAVAKSGEAVYKTCCHMMLVRYIETHKGINPWTGSKEDFYSLLPSTVYYEADDHHVKNFAFVEENEIAYVCGSYDSSFTDFAQNLVMVLFGSYEHIYFEADDCDSFAIALKNLFTNQAEFSFDTYVLY